MDRRFALYDTSLLILVLGTDVYLDLVNTVNNDSISDHATDSTLGTLVLAGDDYYVVSFFDTHIQTL